VRDAENLETADGVNYLASVPEGETIRGMVVYNDVIYLHTANHIYRLVDDKRLERVDE